MNDVVAIIPARTGSKGIPFKNFKGLAGAAPLLRAFRLAVAAGCRTIVISSDADRRTGSELDDDERIVWITRPSDLARDVTPMGDVVEHCLSTIPNRASDIVVLLQPTQPMRRPEHIEDAVTLLRAKGYGSVVSVTPVETVDKLLTIWDGQLEPVSATAIERRQEGRPTYKRDGTVYAWYRREGYLPKPWWPLIIPASETCSLDTMDDWHEAERRLREREG